jgi:pseudouridine-5'-phosphate glycosidase
VTGIRILPAVRAALDSGKPIVSLESSVFAQGLPIPENAEAARRMIGAIDAVKAVPAITAVVRGAPALGLEPRELDEFLRRDGVRKVTARDLGAAFAQKANGATTVAAAIAIAVRGGARVLATGGIGGVHRRMPGSDSAAVDESADLLELARTPMVVVCSGAKAILDLPATWERLETLGIPVGGYKTDELPGFYTATTGISLTVRAESAAEIAEIAAAHLRFGGPQAVLVVVPPPPEAALEHAAVDKAVSAAMASAVKAGIRGAEVTPHLLAAVSRETRGRSMAANLALLENNARVAAEIAVELQRVVIVL